jgi:hypothetical protein
MMSDMVEQVARAIWADMERVTDVKWRPCWQFEDEPAESQEAYRSNARAAILAMRAPTPEILSVNTASISWTNEEIWVRMIDAALT